MKKFDAGKAIVFAVILFIIGAAIHGCPGVRQSNAARAEQQYQEKYVQPQIEAAKRDASNYPQRRTITIGDKWTDLKLESWERMTTSDVDEDNVTVEYRTNVRPKPYTMWAKNSGRNRDFDLPNPTWIRVRVADSSQGKLGTFHYTVDHR